MFGSDTLETAIGLTLIYLILSSVCSAGRELIEAVLKTRAVGLERGIAELLHDGEDGTLTRALYEHPLIKSLYFGDYPSKAGRLRRSSWLPRLGGRLPSYIPSGSFAAALFDLLVRSAGPHGAAVPLATDAPVTIETLRATANTIQHEPLRRMLVIALDRAGNDIEAVRHHLEAWFDASMDRVSGWYRRRTQFVLFALALLVAVAANVDTLRLVHHLSVNRAARQALVTQAEAVSHASAAVLSPQAAAAQLQALQPLELPIGWREGTPVGGHGQRILGWLMTALAVSLGAPFWFDLLGRFMSVRSTQRPKEPVSAAGR